MTTPYGNSENDSALLTFDAVRPRLFGIAYRMLGSVADAEDIVQSAWIRWQVTNRNAVQNPDAFLVVVTTRLAINLAQSARAKRETYVGPWLPEPVDTGGDPSLGAERAEGLELAVLLLLEKLTPTERAAYVLREAFDFSYDRIADAIRQEGGRSEYFATERLDRVLVEAGGDCARDCVTRVMTAVDAFTRASVPSDDQTMLVIRVN